MHVCMYAHRHTQTTHTQNTHFSNIQTHFHIFQIHKHAFLHTSKAKPQIHTQLFLPIDPPHTHPHTHPNGQGQRRPASVCVSYFHLRCLSRNICDECLTTNCAATNLQSSSSLLSLVRLLNSLASSCWLVLSLLLLWLLLPVATTKAVPTPSKLFL